MTYLIKSSLSARGKGFSLLLMMALGALTPHAHALSFLIQYLLMIMLFLAFLDIELKPHAMQKSVVWVQVANVAVAFSSYALLARFDHNLALAAFMTAIAPTAIASPVIISFIQGNVEYVVTALLLTNISSAFIIPTALPFLLGTMVRISIWEVLRPVLVVMFIPLALALAVARLPLRVQSFIRSAKPASFPIWLVNLFIISANASNFLRTENSSSTTLLTIAWVSLCLCFVNFGLGALIGGPHYWQEASQALGQKNLSFVIWVALTFINPLVAMGPMFYILYHHLYNSWSIYRFEKRRLDAVDK